MAGSFGSLGSAGGLKTATETHETAHDFDNAAAGANIGGGAAFTINKAALLAQTGLSHTDVYAYDVAVISVADGTTVDAVQGSNTVKLGANQSTGRTGTNNDDNTLTAAADTTITVPVDAYVRVHWVEIK